MYTGSGDSLKSPVFKNNNQKKKKSKEKRKTRKLSSSKWKNIF